MGLLSDRLVPEGCLAMAPRNNAVGECVKAISNLYACTLESIQDLTTANEQIC